MSEQEKQNSESKKAKNKAEKKSAPKVTKPKNSKLSLNKIFIILNIVAFLLVLFQIITLFSEYSGKYEELFEQGRVVSINPKNNEVKLNSLSMAEIAAKKLQYNEAKLAKKEDVKEKLSEEVAGEDIIGPMPLAKEEEKVADKEDIIGPMPLVKDEEKKEEVAEVEEPLAPVDYNKANLSVVVVEVGMKQADLDLLKDLPKEVSVAVSPYADELQKKIDFFVRDGRQTLINLMLQSSGFPSKDNGPLSIQASYDEGTINMKMASTLDIANGYIGVLAVDDEVITNKFDKLSPILRKLKDRGLFFGYFKTSSNLNVENDAKPLAADIFGVDYLIDEPATEENINKQLELIKEDLLVNNKRLVIAIRPYPNSVNIIKDWLKKNRGNKIQLAPISYFVTDN